MPVKFYLDKRPNAKTGEVTVRVSIYIKAVRAISTIGYTVSPDAWKSDEEKVVSNYKNTKGVTAKLINNRIKSIKSHFDAKDILTTSKPTEEELYIELAEITGSTRGKNLGKDKNAEEQTVLQYFEQFVREESIRGQWTPGTLQCWHAFKQHLKAQGKDLKFSYFTERNLQKFIDYLRKDRKMQDVTVKKHFDNMKWFLLWAIRNGYCKEDSINRFRPKFKVLDNPVIFLNTDELSKLYHYTIPHNGTEVTLHKKDGKEYKKIVTDSSALEKTRDLFCFCSFTSLRYSDMAKLRRTDIGDGVLYVTTKKTNDRLVINLNDFSKSILDKYKDVVFPNDRALPVISNQKMNQYIKDLCELCEFTEPITKICYRAGEREEVVQMKWELVGTHAARRTFICYAIANGIPPETVMKWTGHSDDKAMKPYIDVAEKTKQEAMEKINEELKKL